MKTITALNKPIANDAIGVDTTHHVIATYFVDLVNKATQANVSSFVTAKATRSVDSISVNIPGAPPAGVDAVQWIYGELLKSDAPANALAGAKAVYAEA